MEYRLSWEMPLDSWKLTSIERMSGRDIWPRYDWDTLGEWVTTEVVWREGDESDHLDQHAMLKRWAEA
jgi:hypothetical protein